MLPSIFAKVHPKLHTPIHSQVWVGIVAGVLAGLFNVHVLSHILSVGTLVSTFRFFYFLYFIQHAKAVFFYPYLLLFEAILSSLVSMQYGQLPITSSVIKIPSVHA